MTGEQRIRDLIERWAVADGTPADFDRDPLRLLRLSIGLAKVSGRWVVTHEHHSFADTAG
jgi:hypothetical protein